MHLISVSICVSFSFFAEGAMNNWYNCTTIWRLQPIMNRVVGHYTIDWAATKLCLVPKLVYPSVLTYCWTAMSSLCCVDLTSLHWFGIWHISLLLNYDLQILLAHPSTIAQCSTSYTTSVQEPHLPLWSILMIPSVLRRRRNVGNRFNSDERKPLPVSTVCLFFFPR